MSTRKKKRPFSDYAAYYDLLYADKDYAGETAFIFGLIKQLLPLNKNHIRVLDMACGTGRHAMELAKLGYNVEGSDIAKEMVSIAMRESQRKGLDISFYNESFQTCNNIGKKYNVILAMFSAINYLTSYNDLQLAFRNISHLLDDEGIFIFDFWNGNAVINNFSPVRVKRMARKEKEIIRISTTSVDHISQIATVVFEFILLENGKVASEFTEKHAIRYFFLQEMLDLLRAHNFNVVLRCPFMSPSANIKASDWNVTYVVRKMR